MPCLSSLRREEKPCECVWRRVGYRTGGLCVPLESSAETGAVIERLRRHLTRLSAPLEKSLAFSILNLHSALGKERWRDIETSLTALLESRINGNSVFARPQMHICDEGLIFATMQQGFWFVPFSDLESAVKPGAGRR